MSNMNFSETLCYIIDNITYGEIMTKKKRELDSIYQTYKNLTLSELEDAFSNAETPEKVDFFLNLYNLKLAEHQQKIIEGEFIL